MLARNPRGDWYARKLEDHRDLPEGAAPLSAAWRARPASGDPVRDLPEVLHLVRNLARIQGVPPHCRIAFAELSQVGAGAAGFLDGCNKFAKPFLLLDKAPYGQCRPAEVYDVYAGIALHEAGHLLHTRDGYRRAARGLSPLRRIFENLWEDERIEQLGAQDSPGFAGYFEAARKTLLDRGELGQSLQNWDDLPDLDKVNVLIFAFVRRPHLLTEAMRSWQAINGECVFATLRKLVPGGPKGENDVERLARRLEKLCIRLRKLYGEEPEGRASRSGQGGTPNAADRQRHQSEADEEDRTLAESDSQPPPPKPESSPMEAVKRWLGAKLASKEPTPAAKKPTRPARKSRAGRRFALPEMEESLGRYSRISLPVSPEEARGPVHLVPGDFAEDKWDWDGTRRTVIEFPRLDAAARTKYDEARREVHDHVAAMRAVFAQRLRHRTWYETERTTGTLHGRRLAYALSTDRLFRRRNTQPQRGLALGLLLDESGSMGEGPGSRSAAALRAAVLIVEALRGLPGIELEVYSHTSCGSAERDCQVRYLFGKRNPHAESLGCYGKGRENYDHQALATAARLLEQNTRCHNRLLLVLSDGSPAGRDYGGDPAVRATRAAVEAARRRGFAVLNVAVAHHQSEAIFGAAHVVRFTDLGRLVADMRRLVTGLVRRAVS